MPKWPHIYQKEHRSGNSGWVVDAGQFKGKKRYRRGFKTQAEAKRFAQDLRKTKEKLGRDSTEELLDSGELVRQANKILSPYGADVLEAAKYYEQHFLKFKEAPVLNELAKQHLSKCQKLGASLDTIRDIEQRLSGFLAEFGDRKPSSVTQNQLRFWFSRQSWKPRNFHNYRNKIGGLFNFAKKSGYIEQNPVEKIDKPRILAHSPEIYSIDECASLLKCADSEDLLVYIAIGLFAGLRPAELSKIEVKAISLATGFITVGASIAKGRSQRNVKIEPVLSEWLGRVEFPKSGLAVEPYAFRWRRERLSKKAKLDKWIQDGLRHTFGSYHYVKFGNEFVTSNEMGHRGTEVFHKYYKALATPKEAGEFWNLTPNSVLGTS